MKIRYPVLGAFCLVSLVFAYLLLSEGIPGGNGVSDKVQHFLGCFIEVVLFYWILDTSRRRLLTYTLSFLFSVSLFSEVLQAIIPNGRTFDILDVLANVAGGLLGVLVCILYHKRMLSRREGRNYNILQDGGESQLRPVRSPEGDVEEGNVNVDTVGEDQEAAQI